MTNIPIRLLLWCPECSARHVDKGAFASRSHHTHACQTCGHVWRPAVENTIGVQFLAGFNDDELLERKKANERWCQKCDKLLNDDDFERRECTCGAVLPENAT